MKELLNVLQDIQAYKQLDCTSAYMEIHNEYTIEVLKGLGCKIETYGNGMYKVIF